MPVQRVPVQPGYEDTLTELDLQAMDGVAPSMDSATAQLLAQTQPQYNITAEDLQGSGLQEQYAQAQQQALLAEDQAANQYEQQLANLRSQGTQTDLSPLMALADAWGTTPSNLAASYKRPMSQEQRDAQIMSLQEKLMAQKQKAASGRTSALQSAISAYKASRPDANAGLKTQLMQSTIAKNNAIAGITPGERSSDIAFGKEYQDWRAQGGYAEVEKNLQALDQAAQALEQDPSLTGGMSSLAPDAIRKRTNPKGFAVQQSVEQAIQSGLRQTLGAQFTEKEGAQFLARAYDPALSGQENARRIRQQMAVLQKQAAAKEQAARHFEQYGTLKGLPKSAPIQTSPQAAAPQTNSQWSADDESRLNELKAKAGR